MTIDAVRRKSTRTSRREREQRDELPIGESDANIFNCPVCARPLAVGTRRCAGCSTRLLAGVRTTRAVGFMAIGVLVGGLLTGTIVGGIALLSAPSTAVAVQPDPIAAASAAPVPTAAPPAPVVDPAVPAAALSALSQSNLLNQRLVADAARLETALTADPATSVEIARALRALSATAAFGDRIAPDVATWSDGFQVSAGLETFYDAVGATARDGLAFSLQNRDAYIDAGRAMLKVMAGLPALDAAARDLAATADLDLPALTGTAPAP